MTQPLPTNTFVSSAGGGFPSSTSPLRPTQALLTALQRMPQASFLGTTFPVESVSVTCEARVKDHEYWKRPGAQSEKGGRRPYMFKMKLWMLDNIPSYPNLFPQGVQELRQSFDFQATHGLMVPNVGLVQAFIVNWSEELHGAVQNGVVLNLTWKEDLTDGEQLSPGGLVLKAQTGIGTASAALTNLITSGNYSFEDPVQSKDLFGSIQDVANDILAFKDQTDLYQQVIVAKLEGLVAFCNEADDLRELGKPTAYPIVDALHDLWTSAQQLLSDVLLKSSPTQIYPVERLMTISQVSQAIFGDTGHAVELLQMNDLDDALNIPRGTQITYYGAAA